MLRKFCLFACVHPHPSQGDTFESALADLRNYINQLSGLTECINRWVGNDLTIDKLALAQVVAGKFANKDSSNLQHRLENSLTPDQRRILLTNALRINAKWESSFKLARYQLNCLGEGDFKDKVSSARDQLREQLQSQKTSQEFSQSSSLPTGSFVPGTSSRLHAILFRLYHLAPLVNHMSAAPSP